MFTFNTFDFEYDGINHDFPIPTSLPKLKTFIYLEAKLPILGEVLEACEKTLERLVMTFPHFDTDVSDEPLPKLKTLVLVDRSGEQDSAIVDHMLTERSPPLEHVAIYNLKFGCTLDAFHECELPHLKDLSMHVDEETTLEPFTKFEKKLKEEFPSAQVNLERKSFEKFLDHFTSSHCGGVTNCKMDW